MRTSVKKLAEIEKWEPEPPSIFSHLPKGVSTASNATEPTTRRDIGKIRGSGFGFRVSGFGFRVSGFWFRDYDLRSYILDFCLLTAYCILHTADCLQSTAHCP